MKPDKNMVEETYGPMMAVLCIKRKTKFLYTKNKWH